MVIGFASLASRHWARSLSRKAGRHHSWSLAARHWLRVIGRGVYPARRGAIIHGHWLRVIGFASLGAEFIPQGGAPSFMVIGCALFSCTQ